MLRHSAVIIVYFSCVFSVIGQQLNLYEGSNCTRDGLEGRCVNVFRCLSTKIDKTLPSRSGVESSQFPPICSFKGKTPVICCTDCNLVNDTRDIIVNKDIGILYRTGPKAKNKCIDYLLALDYPCKTYGGPSIGVYLNPLEGCLDIQEQYPSAAFNGVPAKRNEFPHMALLGYGDDVNNADWLCGGSVISERFILTAGHCISSPSVGPVKYIALGILKRTDPSELWQHYDVQRVIPHPDYKPPSKYHDIALLQTDKQITFSQMVRPACLHTEEQYPYASATGWGALGHRMQLADNLQAVFVEEFSEAQCSLLYPPHRHLKSGYNHTTQMCYGDKFKQQDTCEGDSGGPLQISSYGRGCMYLVIGVTSYGRQCGVKNGGNGIYTRVIHYVPWIESIVWPDQ